MTDIEQDLRDRLRAAPPSFAPVPLAEVAIRVEHRRRTARAALLTTAALFSGGAILVPVLALGHGVDVVNNSAGGAADSRGIPAAGGGQAQGPVPGATRATPPGTYGQPVPGPGCPPRMSGNAVVDYVDFVRIGGREYLASGDGPERTVPRVKLGRRLGTVRCNLSTIRPDPYYHPVDGDAGYLPAGTPLYEVASSGPGLRLAAPVGGRYRLYDTYPGPR